jgi:hypothetical protein
MKSGRRRQRNAIVFIYAAQTLAEVGVSSALQIRRRRCGISSGLCYKARGHEGEQDEESREGLALVDHFQGAMDERERP